MSKQGTHQIATSTSTASELSIYRRRAASTADEGATVIEPIAKRRLKASETVKNAVFGYLRAVRALDRTTISTEEIARALSLPIAEVAQALEGLKTKGVKPVAK